MRADRSYSTDDVRSAHQTWQPVPPPVSLQRVIRNALLNALAFTDGSRTRAAGHLGITPRSITYLCQRHGIPSDAKPWTALPPARRRRTPRTGAA